MNKYFIRMSIEKIEILHRSSLDSIYQTIKTLNHMQKMNLMKKNFLRFVNDLFSNSLSEQQISKFLNKKYKNNKVKDYIDVTKELKGYKISFLKKDEAFDLDKSYTDLKKSNYQFELAIKTPIVNLITLYEGFVRLLIASDCDDGNLSLIKDETINLSRLEQLKYDEKAIKNYLVDDYCNSKLFGDKKRIREVIRTLAIDCKDCEYIIDNFEEIYFRRNMYVHSIDKVTTDYRSLPDNIKSKWIDEKNQLRSPPEYFDHAFDITKQIILMILIKKCLYKEKSFDDLNIIEELIFDLYYCKGLYGIATFAYKQLKGLEWLSDTQRYFYFVNYMVCLKNTNKDELDVEMKKWKTETTAPIFKLAKKLVKDDYSDINTLIKSILKTQREYDLLAEEERAFNLVMPYINTWPLFENYRNTVYYRNLTNDFKDELPA
ncbi:MAG: hypothetical protein K2M47_00435 [Clostridiales bacterium]|nr:hypothetical protein [Clostridiales bacterium]